MPDPEAGQPVETPIAPFMADLLAKRAQGRGLESGRGAAFEVLVGTAEFLFEVCGPAIAERDFAAVLQAIQATRKAVVQ